MHRTEKICFANQKGGVGKTTSAVNIAACLARSGRKVLFIDSDPQGNATSGLGIKKKNIGSSVYDVLIGRVTAREATVKTSAEGLFIIPSSIDLVGAELELVDEPNREFRLRSAIESLNGEYD